MSPDSILTLTDAWCHTLLLFLWFSICSMHCLHVKPLWNFSKIAMKLKTQTSLMSVAKYVKWHCKTVDDTKLGPIWGKDGHSRRQTPGCKATLRDYRCQNVKMKILKSVRHTTHLYTIGFYPLKKNEMKIYEQVRKYAYKNTARTKELRNKRSKMPLHCLLLGMLSCASCKPQVPGHPSILPSPIPGRVNLI